METKVRVASGSDAALIGDFNCRLARETEHRDLDSALVEAGVRAALASPAHGRYLLAEIEGRVVGQLFLTYEWSDWRNGMFWWLQSVYVLPEYRRRGVFRHLHGEVLAMAHADGGVCGNRLYVERENGAAQATYRALGFVRPGYEVMEQALEAGSR